MAEGCYTENWHLDKYDSSSPPLPSSYKTQHRSQYRSLAALLEKCWRISLYLTDDAIAKEALCDVKFRQIEGNDRKFRHIELTSIASSVKLSNSLET